MIALSITLEPLNHRHIIVYLTIIEHTYMQLVIQISIAIHDFHCCMLL